MQGYIKVNRQIIVIDGLAERGKAGLSMMPSLLFELRKWWHSPYINHFISADTVVTSYANPQSLNQFAYVLNNPIRYSDPTGHWADEGCGTGGPGGGTGCNLPPSETGSTGGTSGNHDTSTDNNTGGNTTPPIIIPPIDTGPIIIIPLPGTDQDKSPQLPEPPACTGLEQDYHQVLDQILSLQEQVHDLQETLRLTTDPQHKKELEQQIKRLYNQMTPLLIKRAEILAKGKSLGCSFAG